MKYLHWRRFECEALNHGLTFYPLSCEHSFGFMLLTDRVYVRVRYSKRKKKWFCMYEPRDPKIWRILKSKE